MPAEPQSTQPSPAGPLPGHQRYPHLFSPLRIGRLDLPNRATLSSMSTASSSLDGTVSQRQLRYYIARAEAGLGLVMHELTTVDASGIGHISPRLDDDRFIPGLREVAETVHAAGSLVSVQLAHQGRRLTSHSIGRVPVAPSSIPRMQGEPPRPLLEDEVVAIIRSFGEAARRAQQAGFDGVELHMAHGYLIQQFFSPISNDRTDGWGGDFEGRARFALEVVRSVRVQVGPDFAVTCKLAVEDGVEGGYPIEEGLRLAKRLEEAGIDAITASVGGAHGEALSIVPPMTYPRGFNVPLSRALKREVAIPIGVVGRITTPDLAEQILAEGSADYIALGRALIADVEWVRKAAEGREAEIVPCIGCLQGCYDRLMISEPVACLTNPRAARELDLPWTEAPQTQRVAVIGGGIAGMQAAVTAARRGHDVTLWERGDVLGGQWRLAAMPPGKEEFEHYREYLVGEVERRSVRTVLGKEATAEAVAAEQPDLAIVAAGPAVTTPAVPGDGTVPVHDLRASLFDAPPPGEHFVVAGSTRACWEAARWLAARGKRVTLLSDRSGIGRDASASMRRVIDEQMRAGGVQVLLNARIEWASAGSLRIDRDGIWDFIHDVDAVVVNGDRAAQPGLAQQLADLGVRAVVVGDARDPRDAFRASHEGFKAGYQVGVEA